MQKPRISLLGWNGLWKAQKIGHLGTTRYGIGRTPLEAYRLLMGTK